jgi:glycosyltransferase involved in cell wall biosynthesis
LQQNALRVFYLWDFGVTEKTDKGFGKVVKWDVDLLEGYDHELVPNVSARPGTDWFGGLDNPGLSQRVKVFAPDAVLQFGYNYKSLVNFDLRWNTKRAPLLFRGDSHLLAEDGERGKGQEAMGTRLKRWMREIGLRLHFRRFACFLAVGKANADYFRAHGVPESKIVRCPHVVDNAFFIAEKNAGTRHEATGDKEEGRGLREELGIPEDELVFLFAGKLEEKKQPGQLLEAFLAADLPKATLLFVGSGELESALKEKAKGISHGWKKINTDIFSAGDPAGKSSSHQETENCQLTTDDSAHRVVFLEFQNQSRMPAVYGTGDVLVLPSKGRYETWGLAVNEAACCGLPTIVSSHVGCGPDLIEDGVTGWIFEAGNVLALKRALETAAANRHRLAAMGEALKQRVTREYSYQSATEALLAALNKL